MKKIVFMADTHTYHHHIPDVPDGDILVHCGDFTLSGTLKEAYDFAEWFKKQPHPYKVIICGNHETCLSQEPTLADKLFSFCYYLEESSVEIEGLKFYGSPWTESFKMMREGLGFYKKSTKKCFRGIPKDVDILVTHGPPYGILDEPHDGRGYRCGDRTLMSRVLKRNPLVHAFGHIHEGHGVQRGFGDTCKTVFINCSLIDHTYNLIHKPIVYKVR